jgi:iron complex outermembrane receptor protein
LAVALTLLAMGAPALAQSRSLTGRILDAQGDGVAGATVRVSRVSGGPPIVVVSGADGTYTVGDLMEGAVIVQVDRAGFRRAVESVTVTAGGRTTRDVRLEVAGVDESVVVTAAGVPQALRETSKAISPMDATDIRRRRVVSLSDIVRIAPGVQVRDAGGPGQPGTLRVRGLRADAAAVLVDGMRFRDAASAQGDAGAFFSNLSFVSADRVEVLRGSGSSLYGTNAVGGVVNVVSAIGGGPFGGEAQVEYGSLGQVRGRGSVSGRAAGGRIAFSAGGLGWDVADGLDGDDAARSEGAQAAVRFQIDSSTSVWARYFGSRDRVASNTSPTASGIPSANIPERAIVDAIAVAPGEIERLNRGQPFEIGAATFFPGRNDPDARRQSAFQTLALRLERQPSSSVSWQVSYQRVATTRSYVNGPLGPGFQTLAESVSEFDGDIDTLDVRSTAALRPWITVSGGYELEREGYFEHIDDNLPPPARLITEARASQVSHAVFGSAHLTLLDRRLHVGLSGRAQLFRPSSPEFSTVGTTNPYEGLELDPPPSAVTGDVSAAYFMAATGTKLRAHVGNAYRAPALYERFGGGFFSDPSLDLVLFSPFGDPRLEPDRYRTADAGVDQYVWGERALVSATVFAIDVMSLSAFDFTGGLDPATDPFGRFSGYINGSGGFSRGVELGLDVRPGRAVRVEAAYAYTDAETDDDISVSEFFKVPSVSAHTASLIVGHAWRDVIDATMEVFYASSSFTPLFANGQTRAYRFPGFTTMNAVASWRVGRAQGAPVHVYLRIDNLFDDTYYVGGWRGLGRTASAGVSVGLP